MTDRPIHDNPGRRYARAEVGMLRASTETVRTFLRTCRQQILEAGPQALTAAGELPETAAMLSWWQDAVDQHLADEVRAAWMQGYRATTDLGVVQRSLDAVGEYVLGATDRLSRTAQPLIPEQAWERLQVSLAQEMSIGSTRDTISRRIAAELRWDTDTVFWEQRKSRIAQDIDRILDPIGQPGDPAREAARLNDPRVRELQAANREATSQLDRKQSVWKTRADRIARTETTGAYNGGSWDAALRAGARYKQWSAIPDNRTRGSHRIANGQTVPHAQQFDVGGVQMQYPGDPNGGPEEVVNCRCTMLFPADPGGASPVL